MFLKPLQNQCICGYMEFIKVSKTSLNTPDFLWQWRRMTSQGFSYLNTVLCFTVRKKGRESPQRSSNSPDSPKSLHLSSPHPTPPPPPDSPHLPALSIQSNESQNLIINPQRIIPRVAVTSCWNIHCNFLSVAQVAIGVEKEIVVVPCQINRFMDKTW